MAVISKGITLSYVSEGGGGSDYTPLTNLMEIPELGGDYDAIEVTTLADSAHMYVDGLKNYGDSLAFKFLFEEEQFQGLASRLLILGEHPNWQVSLPNGNGSCKFSGAYNVKLDGVGVGAALTYTLTIKPTSEMVWDV